MDTNIYVFQTSVQCREEIRLLKSDIEQLTGIKQWNFDLDDPGFRIFRIEAMKNVSGEIVTLFARFNLKCVPLTTRNDNPLLNKINEEDVLNIRLFLCGIIVLLVSGIT